MVNGNLNLFIANAKTISSQINNAKKVSAQPQQPVKVTSSSSVAPSFSKVSSFVQTGSTKQAPQIQEALQKKSEESPYVERSVVKQITPQQFASELETQASSIKGFSQSYEAQKGKGLMASPGNLRAGALYALEKQYNISGGLSKQAVLARSEWHPDTRIAYNKDTGAANVRFPYAGAEYYGSYSRMVRQHPELTTLRLATTPFLNVDLALQNKQERMDTMVKELHATRGSPKGGVTLPGMGMAIVSNPWVQFAATAGILKGGGYVVGKYVSPKIVSVIGKLRNQVNPRNLWLGDAEGAIAPHKIRTGIKIAESNKLSFVGKSGMPEETGFFKVIHKAIYKPGNVKWSYDFPTKPGMSIVGAERQSIAIEKDILGSNVAKLHGEQLTGVKSVSNPYKTLLGGKRIKTGLGASFLESKTGLPLGGLRTETELIIKKNPLRSLEVTPFFEYAPKVKSFGELGALGIVSFSAATTEKRINFMTEYFNANKFYPVAVSSFVHKPVSISKLSHIINTVNIQNNNVGFIPVSKSIRKSSQEYGMVSVSASKLKQNTIKSNTYVNIPSYFPIPKWWYGSSGGVGDGSKDYISKYKFRKFKVQSLENIMRRGGM